MLRTVYVIALMAMAVLPCIGADMRPVAPAEMPHRENRLLAQFFPNRNNTPTVQYPQQRQAAPQATPVATATPVPNISRPVNQTRRRTTPKRREAEEIKTEEKKDAEAPVNLEEPKVEVGAPAKPAATGESLSKMMKDLEKEKANARKLQAEMDKAADDATTAVAQLLRKANEGKYSEAFPYLTPELQKYFESEMSAVNGSLKTVLDSLTHSGDILSVTYVNATVRGEGVIVDAEMTFSSGPAEKRSFDVIKTKNGWKIILPVTAKRAKGAEESAASEPSSLAPAVSGASAVSAPPVAANRGLNPFASTPVATPAASVTPLPPTPAVAAPETSGIPGGGDNSVSLAVPGAPWRQ